MKKRIINANEARYISQIPEFKNELPKGILNKKRADVGGTFAALSYPTHYIIVVPTLSLIESIKADKNVPYTVFDVKGGAKEIDFDCYIEANKIHKIIVTYDSFYKISLWLSNLGISTVNYKVLVDEFHDILNHYDYRKTAIDSLIKNVSKFNHVTFMSATPINDIYIPKFLRKQPYTVIEWKDNSKIIIEQISVTNTRKSVINFIEIILSEKGLFQFDGGDDMIQVEELYIFVNSVNFIASTCKSLKLDTKSVKVVCGDSIRNEKILKNANLEISAINDPNKKINFLTSRAFAGCNIFTNNGLAIAVSDTSSYHTLIDIETTLYQINGRFRKNNHFNNVFSDQIVHIISTHSMNYYENGHNTMKQIDAIKNVFLDEINKSRDYLSIHSKLDGKEKTTYKNQLEDKPLFCIYNESKDEFELNELAINHLKFKINLIENVYFDRFNVIDVYENTHFTLWSRYELNNNNSILLKLALKVNFKDLILDYINLRRDKGDEKVIDRFDKEYPLFKEACDVLGPKGISSCNYSKTKIERKLIAYSEGNVNKVIGNIFKRLDEDKFISKKELKLYIIDEYKKLNIDIKKVGFTNEKIIRLCTMYKFSEKQLRIDKKPTHGYVIKPDFFNYILGLAS